MARTDMAAASLPLLGIDVAELDDSYPVRFAGRILADLGASVSSYATARRDGDAVARALDAHLSAGKKSIGTHERLTRDHVDVALTSRPLPAGVAVHAAAIVSPFGATGPKRGFRATELISLHAGGLGYLTPRRSGGDEDEPEGPPLWCAGEISNSYGGAHAAAAALVALYGALTRNHTYLADVSLQDVMVPMLRREVAVTLLGGRVPTRHGETWKVAPHGIRRVRDGFVRVHVVEESDWRTLAEIVGHPEWTRDPGLDSGAKRYERQKELAGPISTWLADQTMQEVFEFCLSRGVPVGPCFTPAQVVSSPQLRERNFFRDARAQDGSTTPVVSTPLKLDGQDLAPGRVPPPNDQAMKLDRVERAQSASRASFDDQPLKGIRVLDFGHVWASPYATQLLALTGAEVIKIESRRRVDLHRRMEPYVGEPGLNRAASWNMQNSGKRSVTINLATPAGLDLVKRLIALSDGGVENFSPGTLERLGLGMNAIMAVNPRFILVSMSGFGADGPYRDFKAYGSTIEAQAGLTSLIGYPGGPPQSMGGALPDTTSAVYGVIGLVAGLIGRARTNRGMHVELSELECTASLIPEALLRYLITAENASPQGTRHPHMAPHGVYPTIGVENWIAIAVEDDRQWQLLRGMIQSPALDRREFDTASGRLAATEILDGVIAQWTRSQNGTVLEERLQRAGIPATRSLSARDLLDDDHLRDRGLFAEVAHPEAGRTSVYTSPWKFVGQPRRAPRPAPVLGGDNDYVFSELLHLSRSEIDELAAEQVIY